jgi:CcmD family protein
VPDNNGYIVAAYAITWAVIIAYMLRLNALMRRARAHFAEASRAGSYDD